MKEICHRSPWHPFGNTGTGAVAYLQGRHLGSSGNPYRREDRCGRLYENPALRIN